MSASALVRDIPFVGRTRELAILAELLAQSLAGTSAVAMLVGEAGIGKTRTAQELGRMAAASGAKVLWGRAEEDGPAYSPWASALTPLLESRALPAAEVGILARLLPAGAAAGLDAPVPARLPPAEERLRLLDAVVRALTGSERAVVVILDDLHVADPASLDLLEFVARSIERTSLFLVGTHRALRDLTSPLTLTLGRLNRAGTYVPIALQNLDLPEVAALVESLAGMPFPPQVTGAICTETRGNPFFVGEVVRGFVDQGLDPSGVPIDPAGWAIPPTVREAIALRIARLSEQARRLLVVASAFSGSFDFATLAAASELPDNELLGALDEALAAGFVQSGADGPESYEFTHALVRHALYGELGPSRRARLHRRIAQSIERVHEGMEDRVAAELAVQYHRSRTLAGAAHGIGHALVAAEQAERRSAQAEAVGFLRMAADLSDDAGASRRGEVLSRLALGLVGALQVEEGLEMVEGAIAAMREAHVPDVDIAAFLERVAALCQEAGAPQKAVESLVQQGLALVGGTRDLLWARLQLATYPIEPLSAGPFTAGRWLGFEEDAVRIAREQGDATDHARTVVLFSWLGGRRQTTDEFLERVRSWEEPAARIHGLSVVIRSLIIWHGGWADVEPICAELRDLSDRVGSVVGRGHATVYLAHPQIARGELEAARETATEAERVVARLGSEHRLHTSLRFVQLMLADYEDGDLRSIASMRLAKARDPRTPPEMTALHIATAAYAHARSGDESEALQLLSWLVPLLERLGPTTINQSASVSFSVAALWHLGRAEYAERLRRLARAIIAEGVGDYTPTSSLLTIARASALLAEVDEARKAFASARADLRAGGRFPLVALADYDEASAVSTVEPAVAAVHAEAAREQFERLGMSGWARRADRLRANLAPARPSGLTRREVEVLGLLAAGRTNREIAAELVLSVHTVERHLANVYLKIGARNRADAGVFAVTHGLARTT